MVMQLRCKEDKNVFFQFSVSLQIDITMDINITSENNLVH